MVSPDTRPRRTRRIIVNNLEDLAHEADLWPGDEVWLNDRDKTALGHIGEDGRFVPNQKLDWN